MALTDSLVAYYALDEASGNALDSHGSNDLTDHMTSGSDTGKINGARVFDNNTTHFSRASNSDLQTGDIDFTLQAWVYLDNKDERRDVFSKATGSDPFDIEYELLYDSPNDRFQFRVFNSGASSADSVLADNFGSPSLNTWYLVHAWHDAANNLIGISVNAGTANTASTTVTVTAGSAALQLGRYGIQGGIRYWSGRLDECAFWKRVLTSQERTDLYNSGNGLSYDDFGGAETYTATAALTAGNAELSAAATHTAPAHTATAALVAGAATSSGAATFAPGTKTATAALAVAAATSSSEATFAPGAKTAAAALTAGEATLSAAATFVAPVYTASAALSVGAVTLSASATFATVTFTATSALTAGNALLSASATFSPPVYTATAALTAGNAELSASAAVTNPTYTATAALSAGNAELSASALFAAEVYQATAALTAGEATLSASATFAPPAYTATSTLVVGETTLSASATHTPPSSAAAAAALSVRAAALQATARYMVYTATATLTVGNAELSSSVTFTSDLVPGLLLHSPADVVRHMLIGLGVGDHPLSSTWPVYAGKEPPTPDEVITVFDTAGRRAGRDAMTGEAWFYRGLQVRVRARTYARGAAKASQVASALDRDTHEREVAFDGTRYVVHAVVSRGDVLHLGKDAPRTARDVFTINALASISILEV